MKNIRGQALFEAIAVLAVIGLVMVGLLKGLTLSLKNVQLTKERGLAESYAQEVVEWLIFQRDADWNNIGNKIGFYCFDQLYWDNLGVCESGEFITGTTIYRRWVNLSLVSPDPEEIQAEVIVSWLSPRKPVQGETFSLTTNLTRWK